MAIKLDLEKAYDRLNWEFIHNTLVDIGIPNDITSLIWEFITSAKMSLLLNGGYTNSFTRSKGIR